MAAAKKPANKKPAVKKPTGSGVFDVARPGRGQNASSTSKPIIITNRPVIKDDVINETAVVEHSPEPILTRPKRVVITPLSEDDATVSVNVSPPAEKTEPVPESKPEPEPTVTTAAGKPIKELIPETPVAVPDTAREEKQLTPAQADEAVRLAQERAAKLQHMIEHEQYFLPINARQERHNRRIAVVGLVIVILLAAAWYDTALDAGLVPNTFNLPHTSLFSVK